MVIKKIVIKKLLQWQEDLGKQGINERFYYKSYRGTSNSKTESHGEGKNRHMVIFICRINTWWYHVFFI